MVLWYCEASLRSRSVGHGFLQPIGPLSGAEGGTSAPPCERWKPGRRLGQAAWGRTRRCPLAFSSEPFLSMSSRSSVSPRACAAALATPVRLSPAAPAPLAVCPVPAARRSPPPISMPVGKALVPPLFRVPPLLPKRLVSGWRSGTRRLAVSFHSTRRGPAAEWGSGSCSKPQRCGVPPGEVPPARPDVLGFSCGARALFFGACIIVQPDPPSSRPFPPHLITEECCQEPCQTERG